MEQQRPSLLDGLRQLLATLVEGYAILNRRLWVLIVPVGLDLFLWLGPRVSPLRLAESLSSLVAQAASVAQSSQMDPQALAEWTQALQDGAGGANVLDLVSFPLIPSLLPRLEAPAQPAVSTLHWVPEVGWLPLVALAAVVVGLLLWTLYLVPLADLVRGSNERGPRLLRRVPRAWWQMIQLMGIALGAALVFLVLLVVVSWFGALFSPSLGTLLAYLCGAAALWAVFYLYFSPNAVLVSGVKPLRAAAYSAQIVRFNLWSCLGFVALVYIVQLGTMTVWQRLGGYPWAVLVGIVANAYVTGGLLAAGLVFYRDKIRGLIAAAQTRQNRRSGV